MQPIITKPDPRPTSWVLRFSNEDLRDALLAYAEAKGIVVPAGDMRVDIEHGESRRMGFAPATLVVKYFEEDADG